MRLTFVPNKFLILFPVMIPFFDLIKILLPEIRIYLFMELFQLFFISRVLINLVVIKIFFLEIVVVNLLGDSVVHRAVVDKSIHESRTFIVFFLMGVDCLLLARHFHGLLWVASSAVKTVWVSLTLGRAFWEGLG